MSDCLYYVERIGWSSPLIPGEPAMWWLGAGGFGPNLSHAKAWSEAESRELLASDTNRLFRRFLVSDIDPAVRVVRVVDVGGLSEVPHEGYAELAAKGGADG